MALKNKFFLTFLVVLNFCSLKFNCLDVAHPHAIKVLKYLGSTTLVVGRLVKSAENGIFSAGGFPGHYEVPNNFTKIPGPEYQYFLFEKKVKLAPQPKYYAYRSQIGGQGIFFSTLDLGLRGFVSPENRLFLYESVSAGFLALLLSILVTWLIKFYGFTAGIISQTAILLSPQLVVFGGNIWWQPWSYYFPLVLLLLVDKHLFIASLMGFFVKFFFTGYEYITTTFFILFVPMVIKTIYRKEDFSTCIKKIIIAGCGFCVALTLSLLILFYQHSVEQGSFKHGYDHVAHAFARRTTGTGVVTTHKVMNDSFIASYRSVLDDYLAYPAIDARLLLKNKKSEWYLTCHQMIHLLLAITVVSGFLVWRIPKFKYHLFSLLAGTWMALLGSLSWIIIFKAHSYIHQFQNRLVFHMPFSILLAALFGLLLSLLFKWMIEYGNSRLHSHL